MTKFIIALLIVAVVAIFGITWYLQPNDLADCSKTPVLSENCQSVDAIVAVSGGDTAARASWAISLYKLGWSDKLIFSGAAHDKSGPSNAAVMKKLAVDSNVPSQNILIDENSETTGENAQNVKTIFDNNKIKRVILVTSGYHQRRAGLEISKQSEGVTVLNSPVRIDRDWSFWWWTSLRGWWLAISELIKIAVFYFAGIY